MELITHRHPLQHLCRVGGPPVDHIGGKAGLVEDIPHRLHLAAATLYRYDLILKRIHLHKAMDPMLIGTFTSGDTGPQHGAQHRFQRSDIPSYTAPDKASQGGHLGFSQQPVDHLPVRRIPADQQKLRSAHAGRFEILLPLLWRGARL